MRKVLVLAILLIGVLGAQYVIWQERSDVSVAKENIAGNPVDHYVTAGANSLGVVIVAHGFASNRVMMNPWGLFLARAGFDAYVLDEPGHGRSNRPLPAWQSPSSDALGSNLRALIDELIKQRRAEPGRIALVGHSMGGTAVTEVGLVDDRVKATVAISSAYTRPLPTDWPRNLFSLVADRDPANIRKAATLLATALEGGKGEVGLQYGSFPEGTARASVVVPGRNHITILYDEGVMRATAQWIATSLGVDVRAATSVSWPWVFGALAGGVGVVLTIAAMLAPMPRGREGRGAKPVSLLTGFVTLTVAAFSAVLACVYVRLPWTNLAVTDYLLPYFLVMAVVLLALRMLWPRDFDFPMGNGLDTRLGDMVRAAAVFLGYIGAVGAIVEMDLANYIPSGQRVLPLLILAACFWAYFVQEEGLKRAVAASYGQWSGVVLGFLAKLIILATWMGASALPNPQPFLPIIIPVMLILMVVMELFSAFLGRWRYSALSVATFVSLVFAWSAAVTFPLM